MKARTLRHSPRCAFLGLWGGIHPHPSLGGVRVWGDEGSALRTHHTFGHGMGNAGPRGILVVKAVQITNRSIERSSVCVCVGGGGEIQHVWGGMFQGPADWLCYKFSPQALLDLAEKKKIERLFGCSRQKHSKETCTLYYRIELRFYKSRSRLPAPHGICTPVIVSSSNTTQSFFLLEEYSISNKRGACRS